MNQSRENLRRDERTDERTDRRTDPFYRTLPVEAGSPKDEDYRKLLSYEIAERRINWLK